MQLAAFGVPAQRVILQPGFGGSIPSRRQRIGARHHREALRLDRSRHSRISRRPPTDIDPVAGLDLNLVTAIVDEITDRGDSTNTGMGKICPISVGDKLVTHIEPQQRNTTSVRTRGPLNPQHLLTRRMPSNRRRSRSRARNNRPYRFGESTTFPSPLRTNPEAVLMVL